MERADIAEYADYAKIYVQVDAVFRRDGLMLPSEIVWKTGVSYRISHIREIRYGYKYLSSNCNRYKIEVEGEEKYLYFEHNPTDLKNPLGRWFVERKSLPGDKLDSVC